MVNDRLRDAIRCKGLNVEGVALHVGVDSKSVERWVTQDRVPYPKNRHALAGLLRESEAYLWPSAVTSERAGELAGSEVVKIYSSRDSVPRELWERLLDQATSRVDVLVYVGMFLTENPNLLPALRAKGAAGGRVRLLFGDPDSREVARRSADEGIGKNAISAKCRNALAFFGRIASDPGVEIRCHGTTLYNSTYRYDDEMIVNPHVYGLPAPHAPALHLRRLSAASLFETYARCFDTIWETAKLPKW
ncbi:MAG: XRE family transcriptional regulator [Pseudonocardia sp.]|nr:XRE family transcriptional regulator [Pseudonocardia sp.]